MSNWGQSTNDERRLKRAGYKFPLNWDELGSSEKDLWIERMTNDLNKREARKTQ